MIIRELAVTAAGSENGRAVQIRTVGGLAQDQMPGLRETLTLLCRSIQFDRSPPLKFEAPLACCHGWSTRGYTAPANLEAGAPRSASLPFLLLRMTLDHECALVSRRCYHPGDARRLAPGRNPLLLPKVSITTMSSSGPGRSLAAR